MFESSSGRKSLASRYIAASIPSFLPSFHMEIFKLLYIHNATYLEIMKKELYPALKTINWKKTLLQVFKNDSGFGSGKDWNNIGMPYLGLYEASAMVELRLL
ncbi:hypothetical protein NA56DRAFT_709360 [Hyaloscypha hepaticicola]|uniref:Uncharacterized protein n=1 Tax=Hyaloscypha hepaticicola TaxID=2082293 RepID=A0A2J6PPM6_9HELO|nr:hypothetical protein NA56DRAFT_709360 [Hyaloscypha hepaticicola]